MTRTDIINALIKACGYKSYLEIGVYKPKRNFDLIKCDLKHGVDPNGRATYTMTSDEFFAVNKRKYDIIFVDGLHTYEQSKRDVDNALRILTENGYVVMHDCDPPTEWHQREVKGKGDGWNGTVWKTFAELRMTRPDLSMCVVDCDWGVGLIRFGFQECYEKKELSYDLFKADRQKLLKIITKEQFNELDVFKGSGSQRPFPERNNVELS